MTVKEVSEGIISGEITGTAEAIYLAHHNAYVKILKTCEELSKALDQAREQLNDTAIRCETALNIATAVQNEKN